MIFVSSDLHIGKSMQKGIPELAGDSIQALKELAKAIIKHPTSEQKHLILAGDVYDLSRIDGATTKAVGDFLNDLAAADVTIYFVEGNHDRQDPNNSQAVPLLEANASEESRHSMKHLKNGEVHHLGKRTVAGFDYMPPEKLKERLNQGLTTDILVLHQAFEELLPFEGRFDLSYEDIPMTVTHVIAGDIHTKHCTNMTPGRVFLSPGSLHACAIDQIGSHGFWTMGDGEVTWTFHEIPTRQAFKMEIDDTPEVDDSLQQVVGQLKEAAKQHSITPILAIGYVREKAAIVERIRADFGNAFVIIEYPTSSGKIIMGDALPDALKKFERLTMEAALPFVCNIDTDRSVYLLMEELLTAPDASGVIDKFIQERLA